MDLTSDSEQVEYGNGTAEISVYDVANCLLLIERRDDQNALLPEIEYVWNLDDSVHSQTDDERRYIWDCGRHVHVRPPSLFTPRSAAEGPSDSAA